MLDAVIRDPGPYDLLAPIYDAWQAQAGTPVPELVLPRLTRALRGVARPGAVFSFADLGCGTGGLLLGLREANPAWRLCGLDASAAMLTRARSKSGAETIMWIEGDVQAWRPGASFDAAGCFHDTLNHLPDAAALGRALAGAARTLRPGGLMVFDVTNHHGFSRWWRGRGEWKTPGWTLSLETSFDEAARLGTGHLTIHRGGVRAHATLVERCFEDREIRDAIGAAGLHTVSVEPWSPFSLDEPGKSWWVARRIVGRR